MFHRLLAINYQNNDELLSVNIALVDKYRDNGHT